MTKIRCAFLAIASVALGAASIGSPIIVQYNGSSNYGATGAWKINTGFGEIHTGFAGKLGIKWWVDNPTLRVIDGTDTVVTAREEQMYCLSPFDYLNTGKWFADWYDGTVAGGAMPDPAPPTPPEPLSTATKERVAWLANYSLTPGGLTTGFGSLQIATAVQLAIWQAIIRDDGSPTWSLNQGNGDLFILANNLYGASSGQTGATFRFFQDFDDNLRSQDLIVGAGLPQGDPVPEPFTMVLGAAGLALAGRMKRKR